MSDWLTTIEDIAEVFDGPHATPNKTENGPYFLSISSLDNGRLDLPKSAHLNEEDFVKWTRRVTPQAGDLLFSYETRLGEAALMPDGIQACLGRRMGLLRPKKNKVISEYLLYAYLAPQFQQTIISNTITGATVDRLALTELPKFEIRIPPVDEQKKTANLLSALDAKIELNQRINAELEAMAKTLYDYWFVQFDFPFDFASSDAKAMADRQGRPDPNGRPYKSSGGKMVYNKTLKREIPEGWRDGVLSDIGTIVGGSTPAKNKSENFAEDGLPWITPKDLSLNTGNKFISRGECNISERGAKEASLKILPEGSVLLSSRAPIGYMAIARNDMMTNQGFKSFVPDKGYSTVFVYYTVNYSMKAIEQNASGSTFKEISTTYLKMVKCCLPDFGIGSVFAKKMAAILKRQNQCELETQQLTALRDWLLPMLMNGQVRVM